MVTAYAELPDLSAQPISPEYVELALLRHGQSKGNANHGIVQGSGPDPANTLDATGEFQAAQQAGALLGLGILATGIWSSPLPRARQTCQISTDLMGGNLAAEVDVRLSEMCKGLAGLEGGMEGRPREEVETEEYWRQFSAGGWTFRHGSLASGGQTAQEVGACMLNAINDIADGLFRLPPGTLPGRRPVGLVYSHGQSIRYGIGAALGWPDIRFINREYRLGNCHGIIMRRSRNRHWSVADRITLKDLQAA